MSFYVRKSVKAGPFRFNLSKSGVGVSVGIPGFRVGSGPRGNYVHLGKGGVSYRATSQSQPRESSGYTPPPPPPVAEVLLEDVTGASATELLPSGAGEIVDQLNAAAGRHHMFPWALVALVVIILIQPIVGAVLLLPGVPGLIWLWYHDRARRTVVAFYDVNDSAADWFQGIVDAIQQIGESKGLWRVDASGRVQTSYQYKVNAGASTIVSRSAAKTSPIPPSILATNIAVPSLSSRSGTLLFLPDRLLVKNGKRFSDVPYTDLSVTVNALRFTEPGRIPSDSRQVDTTWQYVNVKGGPDRRFKDNRQYPVMLYGELDIGSPRGLNWEIQCSCLEVLESFGAALGAAPTEVLAASR
jgi:Protein of unknown function (DUF4236)